VIIGYSVISDVLLFLSLSGLLKLKSQEPIIIPTEHNAPDLTELLQKSAVEHLTLYRQLQARDFGSAATTVTTDFEALYHVCVQTWRLSAVFTVVFTKLFG